MGGERQIEVYRIREGAGETASDWVAVEEPLALHANGLEVVTLMYTPPMALELALGYLLSEGLISEREDVASLSMKKGRVLVEIKGELPERLKAATVASGCGGGFTAAYAKGIRGIRKIRPGLTVTQAAITGLAERFRGISELFEKTGGVHSAGLSDGLEFLVHADDIGRHNAADKVFGKCLMEGIDASGKLLFTTGRVSSDILIKAARRAVPVVVSRGAPTSLAVELGERLGVTVIGFARGRRMNVYTHPERVLI